MRWIIVMIVVAGCGPKKAERFEMPPPVLVIDAAPVGTPVGAGVDAAPVASGECVADQKHCCMADGTLVTPGGCQPSYPDNVQPATNRASDGSCQPIECHLKCLPEGAMIATPDGERRVDEIGVGDAVWTMGGDGERVAAHVLEVRSIEVVGEHEIVEATLADGRVVRASAGHPLAGAGTVGELERGAVIDGAAVESVRRVRYPGARTWDLLPDGPTGAYWADGVLLGSTLSAERR